MPLINAGKIATCMICAGVVGSAGVGSYFYFTQDSTIEQLIKKDSKKRTILSSTDRTKGSKAWANYKSSNNNKNKGEDAWRLNDWKSNGTDVPTDIPNSLIQACNTKKTEKVKNREQEAYTNFIKWCTEEGE